MQMMIINLSTFGENANFASNGFVLNENTADAKTQFTKLTNFSGKIIRLLANVHSLAK